MNVWGNPTHHLKRAARSLHAQLCNSHTAWNTVAYLRRQSVTFIEPNMWPPSSPDLNPVNYTVWVVLHFLLYVVYICQRSLNFTYAFKCYQQNCSWLHFTWTTLCICSKVHNAAFFCNSQLPKVGMTNSLLVSPTEKLREVVTSGAHGSCFYDPHKRSFKFTDQFSAVAIANADWLRSKI